MGLEDKILFKLGISGMDPGEVERLASQTGEQLRSEMRSRVYEPLKALHAAAAAANDDATRKSVAAQISAHEKLGKEIASIQKEIQVEQNKSTNAWRSTLNDLKNLTVVGLGAKEVIGGMFDKFKHFTEEMIKTTNVFSSLQGSIDGMREASDGQITDMDLIVARNKIMLSDLKLTENQYNLLAKASDTFADVTGTDATSALNALSQALVSGKTKAVEHMFGVIDEKKAIEAYAESLDRTVESLSEQQKAQALAIATFEKMNGAMNNAGESAGNLAGFFETAFARITSGAQQVMAALGGLSMGKSQSILHQLATKLPEFKALETVTGGALPSELAADFLEREDATRKRGRLEAEKIRVEADRDDAVERAAFDKILDRKKYAADQMRKAAAIQKQFAEEAKRAAEEQQKSIAFLDAFFRPLTGGFRPQVPGEPPRELTPWTDIFMSAATKGGDLDEQIGRMMGTMPGEQPGARSINEKLGGMVQGLNADLDKQLDAAISKKQQARARYGAIGIALFGEAPPEELVGVIGDVTGATQMLSATIGEYLFATLAGYNDVPFAERVRGVIKALGLEASKKAVFYGIEALAWTLAGQPVQAATAGKLATAYGAFALFAAAGTAGLGAGPADAGGGGRTSLPATSTPTSRSGGELSGRGGTTGGGGPGAPPVQLFLLAWPGAEADAGRWALQAVEAFERKSGSRQAGR